MNPIEERAMTDAVMTYAAYFLTSAIFAFVMSATLS